MECAGVQYIHYPSRSTEIKLRPISDIHLLNKGCDEQLLRADIKEIKDNPNMFWIGTGDYVDYIGYTDSKRFDPDCVSDKVSVADLGRLGQISMRRIKAIFAPIAHKCVGLTMGNHEKSYEKHKEQGHLHEELCESLGVINLGYSALLDLVFVRAMGIKTPVLAPNPPAKGANSLKVRIYAHHGAGFAQTPGGKLNKLIQFMNQFGADLYFVGHVHDEVIKVLPALGANEACTKLRQIHRLGMICGTYLRTYQVGTTGYAEQKGYATVPLGGPLALIWPDKRLMLAQTAPMPVGTWK
jgi:hypothetical protein